MNGGIADETFEMADTLMELSQNIHEASCSSQCQQKMAHFRDNVRVQYCHDSVQKLAGLENGLRQMKKGSAQILVTFLANEKKFRTINDTVLRYLWVLSQKLVAHHTVKKNAVRY